MVSSGLTVGLSVGVPSAVILGIVCLVWWFNQRKQRKEDLVHDDVDIDLEDNRLFGNIQEEVMKPFPQHHQHTNSQPHILVSGEKDTSSTENHHRFIDSSHSSSSVTDQQPSTPRQSRLHNPMKTPSSYDFYDTVVPVLQQPGSIHDSVNHSKSNSRNNSRNHSRNPSTDFLTNHQQPPVLSDGKAGTSSKNSSTASINNPVNNSKSLDNLAKQLTQPTFFEKLPSRAGNASVRKPDHQQHQYRNLTLGSVSVGTHGSNGVESDSNVQLSKVLGGNFDNSQNSPFTDEDGDQEGVVNGVVFK